MSTYPYSIDHIVTNMTSLFMKSCTVDPGISDQHKLIMSICKLNCAKSKSRILPKGKSKTFFYLCYKNFVSNLAEEALIKNFSYTELSIKSFKTTFSLTLEKLAPLKKKYPIYNNSPFKNRTFEQPL